MEGGSERNPNDWRIAGKPRVPYSEGTRTLLAVRQDSQGRLKETHMAKEQPTLPTNRAFVVQLHRDAKVEAGQFKGRVEHVVSMESTHFETLEEMIAFITKLCRSPRRKH
jgi:hypothetical protein